MNKKRFFQFCLLFLLTIVFAHCVRDERRIEISSNRWILADDSPEGIPGEVYHFLDNGLFFHFDTLGVSTDGKWNFENSINFIKIDTNGVSFVISVIKLDNNNLDFRIIEQNNPNNYLSENYKFYKSN